MRSSLYEVIEYVFIICFAILGVVLFWFFRFNPFILKFLSAVGCFGYVIFGVVHSVVTKRFSRLITLEYSLVGLFVYLILLIAIGN